MPERQRAHLLRQVDGVAARGFGPNALPPRHCGTDLSPWRALPVPFCLYIFLPVTLTSERSCAWCVPAIRFNCW